VPKPGGHSVFVGGVFGAERETVGRTLGCEGRVSIQSGTPWAIRGQTVAKAGGREMRKATNAATSPMSVSLHGGVLSSIVCSNKFQCGQPVNEESVFC